MRKELERKQLNKVIVQEGLSITIPTENTTVDAVIAVQHSEPILRVQAFVSAV